MSVAIFLAQGFEEIEAISVIDVLRRAEIDVCIVGLSSIYVTGSHGITIKCDVLESDFVFSSKIKMIVFPGGMPGTLNLQQSEFINNVIDYALDKKMYIAAICAAPMILGQLGLLRDREAVCFPDFQDRLFGAIITDKNVCKDGKFITARGPGAALEFSFEILGVLVGSVEAEKIKKDMLVKEFSK
ncbi:MAG: DJ-1/PfpI family protein [Oscillospiraceae bacterium]|nr:DJ-1/PfpI family protein [Oscillospiraceae bacterium]